MEAIKLAECPVCGSWYNPEYGCSTCKESITYVSDSESESKL